VLSLLEVAELLRVIERLLQMAESIREMKRVRDFIARRPEAEAHQQDDPQESISVEDAAQVQAVLRSLYSSVNTAFVEPGELPARAPGETTGDGNGSAPVGTQRATAQPVAA
jgi:hypothetical protein